MDDPLIEKKYARKKKKKDFNKEGCWDVRMLQERVVIDLYGYSQGKFFIKYDPSAHEKYEYGHLGD